ncbi:MAG TPA: tetratricopeptide repeat protein [Pyrinomonadaceae bacterium]
MKRRSLIFPAIICLLLISFTAPQASAKDTWTSVRSQNFFLIGNASDKEIRQVAARLEQFRDVFTRLFGKINFTSPVPTTVIVFKSAGSYKPFNPRNDAGYFQPGQDVNYITLSTEQYSEEQDPFRVIFHEYVHLLVNNTLTNVPVWFNEGLAEYYSTFFLDDERKAFIGKLISNHVLYLREQKLIPLSALFAVDHQSPYYNEGSKRGVFYAESWALVHYLIQGNKGQRLPQLGKFVDLLTKGTPVADAFKQAFEMDYSALEKELKAYVQGASYTMTRATFERKLEFDADMQSAPITEADAQSYLGDLLLHSGDLGGAEKRLEQALELDPNQPMANSSLGLVKVRQGKFAEAKPLLQKAVAANSQNYMVHFNYAYALSREGMDAGGMVRGYSPETANEMRAELKKAIELAPTFPESYHLLAFINVVRGEQIDESIALLKRGMSLSPGREDFGFMLAQLYMRKEDFKSARQILEPIARNESADKQLRANAQSMLDAVTRYEEQVARFKEQQGATRENDDAASNVSDGGSGGGSNDRGGQPPRLRHRGDPSNAAPQNGEEPQEVADSETGRQLPIRKPAEGEEQARGLLVRIECDAKGATFVVKVGDQLLKLRTTNFNGIQFTTFTPDVAGDITCGARNPANDIVITFRPAKEARAKFNGDVVAIDFVPKDFELKK